MTLHQKNNCKSKGLNNQLIKSFAPYNYIYKLKKIKFFTSIDFIILSIQYDYKELSRILTTFMVKSPTIKYSRTKTSESKTYSYHFNNRVYEIRYTYFSIWNATWFKIDDPDILFLQHLSNLLHPIQYHVTQVECTADFYGVNIHTIYSSLKNKYLLSHSSRSKQLDLNYEDTEYAGNPRETKSKALRLYKKKDDNGNIKYARLEILYKRIWLKRKNIITIADVSDIPHFLIIIFPI